MCIWNCAVEDRHCEFCSYRGGCELHPGPKCLDSSHPYIAAMTKVIGEDILTTSHRACLAWGRYFVAYKLLLDGYSTTQAGKVINRNHTTVMNARERVKWAIEKPQMYPDEIAIWQKFQELVSLQKHN